MLIEQLPNHLRGVSGQLEDILINVLQDAYEIVLSDTEANFATSSDPRGNAWVPRKVVGDGHPLLIDSGALKGAALGGAGHKQTLGDGELIVGIDLNVVPYARRHNLGDVGGSPMPQREFLGLREEGKNRVAEALLEQALPAFDDREIVDAATQ